MSIFPLLDFSAFTSAWYWILLMLVWVRGMSAVLGVPVDLLRRARRGDGQAVLDVEMLMALRLRGIRPMPKTVMAGGVALWACGLTILVTLALSYGIESAQALLPLAVAMALIQGLQVRCLARIEAAGLQGADLCDALNRLAVQIQLIILVMAFVTAIWGMYAILATRLI
ncbi:MAG: component of SufBCD complex [Qingshengfaniella sp.]